MMKELTIKASMSYNDQDFRETVESFCSGTSLDPSLDKWPLPARPLDKLMSYRHLSWN